MIIGRVTGSVHGTVENAHLEGRRILIVRPVDLEARPRGRPLLCLDRVDAGVGDLVLVNREGGSARLVFDDRHIPVQAVVLGVIDDLSLQPQPETAT